MEFRTNRLILRPWLESDAESLYTYASDPEVGPAAGWPRHQSIAQSREIIKTVLMGEESYALCLASDNQAIGALALKLNGSTDMTDKQDECELGYWIGKPFWGQGLVPEAAQVLLEHCFTDLHMNAIWCGWYEGNTKSRRVQEKLGFVHHHTCEAVPVPLLNEVRVGHSSLLTREQWLQRK